ncbi:MAG: ABC transporter permease [Flavobacteriaceae bacterium]
MIDTILAIVTATVIAGTPLVYAALGELVTEKSGVLNLGVEGMMLVGAISGFITATVTGSVWLGILVAAIAGMAMALIFAVFAISLRTTQVATGLARSIVGAGLSSQLGRGYFGVAFVRPDSAVYDFFHGIPLIGPALTAFHPLVYLSWAIFAAIVWFFSRSRLGLVIKAIGEAPSSAHAIGFSVIGLRYAATLFGGAMAGIGGGYLALIYTSLWVENITAGRGWIAIALVVFATWKPERALLGAYLFGGVTTAQLFAQGAGMPVPSEFMSALPYIATVVVLVLISRDSSLIRLNAPASLGRPFQLEG